MQISMALKLYQYSFSMRNVLRRSDFISSKIHRKYSTQSTDQRWPSNEVYNTFIKFYSERDHKFIRSSSVIPWNDASLFFVNAGMNQFKPVLLSQSAPIYPRAVNSQKCIRVKGKHNDLADVGLDSYHHTFFEMLGSWSFADYFKKESCTLAWKLLTEVYQLPPDRLYVTYFEGDDSLGLPPDTETQQHWLNIGVPANHILPFGSAANFWEMGAVGPCGPCTEVHYWRGEAGANATHLVNADHEDLVELWNIVFIQYQRHADRSISKLPSHHVDTGMGLERITATLNNKTSNYDTDIFTPLFDTLSDVSGARSYSGSFSGSSNDLDTAYRIVADHARMAVVALSDGCLPGNNHILRSILRRLFATAQTHFGLEAPNDVNPKSHWLNALSHSVVSSLSHRHPGVLTAQSNVHNIMSHELMYYNQVQAALGPTWQDLISSEPSLSHLQHIASLPLVNALKQILPLIKQSGEFIDPEVAIRANIQFGISYDLLEEITGLYNVKIDKNVYHEELLKTKRQKSLQRTNHKSNSWGTADLSQVQLELIKSNADKTIRSSVYDYQRLLSSDVENTCSKNIAHAKNGYCYVYDDIHTNIVAIIHDNKIIDNFEGDGDIGLVLKESNFYTESGGQIGDQGVIYLNNNEKGSEFSVTHVEIAGDYVIHWGSLSDMKPKEYSQQNGTKYHISKGDYVKSRITAERRLGCSRHHTATHLLHKAFSMVAGESTQQLSSYVAHNYFTLDVGSYKSISTPDILAAEKIVQDWIKIGSPIDSKQLLFSEALQVSDLSLLSGAIYPDNVTVITTEVPDSYMKSVEVCCGTHLLDTSDVHQFVITNVGSSEGLGVRSVRVSCGPVADKIIERGAVALEQLNEKLAHAVIDHSDSYKEETKKWAKTLLKQGLPYEAKAALQEFNNNINKIFRVKKEEAESVATNKILTDLKAIHASLLPLSSVVHIAISPLASHRNILKAAYNTFEARNYLLVVHTNGAFKARAVVTQNSISQGASAVLWLSSLAKYFPGGTISPGTHPKSLATFSANGVSSHQLTKLKNELIGEACKYIKQFNGLSHQTQK